MKVVLFGASGMVGGGVLLECLDDPRVESVLVVGRRACGVSHPKLTRSFTQTSSTSRRSRRASGASTPCFFCLGVSAAGLSEAEYTRRTYDLTLAAARALAAASPRIVFIYVSGAGTDSTERGRVMWARVKGRTENALLALPIGGAYMLPPGLHPADARRAVGHAGSTGCSTSSSGPLLPLLRRLFPRQITTTVAVGRAMIALAEHGDAKKILGPADINRLAAAGSER